MEKQQNSAKPESEIFTIPNLLSLLRIILIPVIVWLYCVRRDSILAGSILILSGVTDIVDGYIARRFHMVSSLGKILDPVADKLTQGAMLICLLSRFPQVIVPFVLMAAKEIFMSVTSIFVIRKSGTVFGAKWHGKAATCLLYGMILLHMFWYDIPAVVSDLSIAACTLMVLVSFFLYAIRNINVLTEGGHRL